MGKFFAIIVAVSVATLAHADAIYNKLWQAYSTAVYVMDGGSSYFGTNYGAQAGQLVIPVNHQTDITSITARYMSNRGMPDLTTALVQVYSYSNGQGTLLYSNAQAVTATYLTNLDPIFDFYYVSDVATGPISITGLTPGSSYLVVLQPWTADAVYGCFSSDTPTAYLRDYSSFGYPGLYGTSSWTQPSKLHYNGASAMAMDIESSGNSVRGSVGPYLYNELTQTYSNYYVSIDGGSSHGGTNVGAACGQLIINGNNSSEITGIGARYLSYAGMTDAQTALVQVYSFYHNTVGPVLFSQVTNISLTQQGLDPVFGTYQMTDVMSTDTLDVPVQPGNPYLVVIQVRSNDYGYIAASKCGNDDTFVGDMSSFGYSGVYNYPAFKSSRYKYGSCDCNYIVTGNGVGQDGTSLYDYLYQVGDNTTLTLTGDWDGGLAINGVNSGAQVGEIINDTDGSTEIESVVGRFDTFQDCLGLDTALIQVFNYNHGSVGSLVAQQTANVSVVHRGTDGVWNWLYDNVLYDDEIVASNLHLAITPGNQYLVIIQPQDTLDFGYLNGQPDTSFAAAQRLYSSFGYTQTDAFDVSSQNLNMQVIGNGAHTTVSGTLVFNDFFGGVPNSVNIDFEDGSNNLVTSRPTWVAPDGTFTVATPDTAGTYYVSCEYAHWLRRTVGPYDTSSNHTGVTLSLENGDVDGDNAVTGLDYAIWSYSYGSSLGDPNWFQNADLDGDGAVTALDYSIWSNNYGAEGDN